MNEIIKLAISELNRLDSSLTFFRIDTVKGYLCYCQASGNKGLMPNLFTLLSQKSYRSYFVLTEFDVKNITQLLRFHLNHKSILMLGKTLTVYNVQEFYDSRIYNRLVKSMTYRVIKFNIFARLLGLFPRYKFMYKSVKYMCK